MLVDSGRSNMLGTEFQEMLRCIRCAACMNHCPVYGAVGGHAYGWVYPGPMGSVLTPSPGRHRQDRAAAQCLHLLRPLRERLPGEDPAAQADAALARAGVRAPPDARRGRAPTSRLWAWFARRPALYRLATRAAIGGARAARARQGRVPPLPLAGGWTAGRDLPAPEGDTFLARYASAAAGRRSAR